MNTLQTSRFLFHAHLGRYRIHRRESANLLHENDSFISIKNNYLQYLSLFSGAEFELEGGW